MYRKHMLRLFMLAICFHFTSCCAVDIHSKESKGTKKVTESRIEKIVNLNVKAGGEYVVTGIVDLHGANAKIPTNVLLTFKKGGAIVNGTLIGNKTRINSKFEKFLGVRLKGTWHVDKISDIIFNNQYLSDDDIISNLNTIQSDDIFNEVRINRDFHVTVSKSGGSVLEPSSHSILYLNGTLFLEGNDCKSYQIINIKNKDDVSIKGGRIVGDVGKHTYIKDSSSEWGMGVYILQSKNINISDLYITKCTGDGIYITGGKETSIGAYDNASKNISIMNVTCDDNRRQGLSIIHVDGMAVRNCSFINTGLTEFTPPGAGVDIEPNISNGRNMSVQNLVVDNCTFTGNKGASILASYTYEAEGRKNFKNLVFSNCHADGTLKAYSTDLTFRHCTFKEVSFASAYSPTHITMESCIINGGYGINLYVPSKNGIISKDRLLAIDLSDCTISVGEGEDMSTSLFSCNKGYITNIEYINVKDCNLKIPRSKSNKFKLTSNSFNNKLHITNSVIEMGSCSFDATGLDLKRNKIHCAKVIKKPMGLDNKIIIMNN